MSDLLGKVLLITGGSRGIGQAIVSEALRRGARVAYCARTLDVPTVAADGGLIGDNLLAIRADITVESDIEMLFERVCSVFRCPDLVVSNAAITDDGLLVRLSGAQWDRVIENNLTGPFLLARRSLKHFLSNHRDGRIIFVGSVSQNGLRAQANYSTSKGGLAGLTKSIAREFGGRGIRANLLVPGYVETSLSANIPANVHREAIESCPLGRAGLAEEIAAAVLALSAEPPPIANGEALWVSGGLRDVRATS